MIKWFFAVATILFIYWWFFGQTKDLTVLSSKPNLISQQPPEKPKPLAPNEDRIATPKIALNEPQQTATKESKDGTKKTSYLSLYRMHKQWQSCADVVYSLEHANQAYQPLNQLRQKINSHHKNQTTWPTSAQIESLSRHTERCKELMHQLDEAELPSLSFPHNFSKHQRLKAQLSEWLKKTKPVTEKEQSIANVLALITAWQTAYFRVIQASKDKVDPNNDPTTPAYLTDMLGTNSAQTTVLNNPRDLAIIDFTSINEQLYQQLYTADPDVFYEAQSALEQSHNLDTFGYYTFKNVGQIKSKEPFIEYISPGEILIQISSLHDAEWFDLVIQHATKLYLCELGADCGPDSELIAIYCHAGLLQLDPISCELDYSAFLQSHYLNDNQWDDVQYMLSLIKELYAQT